MEKQERPFGLWPSPITPKGMAGGTRLGDVAWDSDGQTLVWLEGRSDQGVLVCADGSGDAPRDLTSDLSVRARVGYGGGDFAVARGHVYFAEASSGRLYRQALAGGRARPITPGFGHAASPVVSPEGNWVAYVHSYEGTDRIAMVDSEGRGWPQQVVSGCDFYMQPCWHERHAARLGAVGPPADAVGRRGALHRHGALRGWEADDHRHPGDRWRPGDGDLPARVLAGRGQLRTSPMRRGWDNLYLYDLATGTSRALTDDRVEVGQPAWAQGMRAYAFAGDGKGILFLRNEGGFRRLCRYDPANDEIEPVRELAEYTWLAQPIIAPGSGRLAAVGTSPTVPDRVVTAIPGKGEARIRARSAAEDVPQADLSTPRPVTWTLETGAQVHGLYYPPASSRFTGSGLPPAIVRVHGGPTSMSTSAYNQAAQFFATRGYAVLEVNYRGSTGYGRDYMLALREAWGVADVEDVVGAARFLREEQLADGDRLVIMGGSAGGYTVWQALVHHPGVFKAGLCLYGVSNLFTLAADTHKFEARYLDSLIGPLPQTSARYRERSPIFFADQIRDPVAIFQGSIDQVVPRAQSDLIVEALRRNGVPHEYHIYEGEGHGWRKRETIAAFWTAVDRFLQEYVLFG
ncbi:MAG: prolyl oligopeptidase family serine peptidase [Chloroflexia bacterium]